MKICKRKVLKGDIIHIEISICSIKRFRRCDIYVTESDLQEEEYISLPEGEFSQKKNCSGYNLTWFRGGQHSSPRENDFAFMMKKLMKQKRLTLLIN